MRYRIWYQSGNEGHWSKYSKQTFTDLSLAQDYCARANDDIFDEVYSVAIENEDGSPSFDVEEPELDTPVPYTLTSALDFLPPVSVSPDAKRFVDIEDLRSAANAVTTHDHEWRIGANRVMVQHLQGDVAPRMFFNGVVLTEAEAQALIFALQGALNAVA